MKDEREKATERQTERQTTKMTSKKNQTYPTNEKTQTGEERA